MEDRKTIVQDYIVSASSAENRPGPGVSERLSPEAKTVRRDDVLRLNVMQSKVSRVCS